MNSFNTHDDTQKVPFSFYFCLQKFDDLLAFVADMLSITFSFFWRLLRSMPTPTLRFTLSIRFTAYLCNTSTSSILIMWHCLHDKQCQLIYLHSLLQSQYPRIVTEDFSPLPSKKSGKDGWLVSLLSYYKVTLSSSDYSNEISHWLVDNLCWRLSDIVWSIHHL